MNNYNTHLCDMIRGKFNNDAEIVFAPDETLLQAYACWHVVAGQDWQTFPSYMNKNTRIAAWAKRARS